MGRSEIIHAERKREQQTFETIEEEEDDDHDDVARAHRRPSPSYSYGSQVSLVDEEQGQNRGSRNNGRRGKEDTKKGQQQKGDSSSLDLERSLSSRALKVRRALIKKRTAKGWTLGCENSTQWLGVAGSPFH